MSDYNRPLPIPDAGTEAFWQALRRHSFILPLCRSCGKYHFYPRELCPYCHSEDLDWKEVSGNGSIYTFTIVRRAASPEFKADLPFAVGLVALDEGPRITTNITAKNVENLRIGQKVKIRFEDVTDVVTLPRFQLVEDLI